MLLSNRNGVLVNARESDSSLIKQVYELWKDWRRNWKHMCNACPWWSSVTIQRRQPFKPLGSTSTVTCLPVHPSICCILHLSVLRIYTFSRCYYKIEIVCASISAYSSRLTCISLTPLFKEVVPGSLVTLAMAACFYMSAALDWLFYLLASFLVTDISYMIYAILCLLRDSAG